MISQPRPRLVIVGQRDFGYEKIFDLCSSLQLRDEVLFLDKVDDELLAILYRHCRAFLYPSFAEGFGMPVLEAMASGAAVITSNTTALAEVAGRAAILVDPNSAESISRAIDRLISEHDLSAMMGAAGLEHFKDYDWNASAESLAVAYMDHFEKWQPALK